MPLVQPVPRAAKADVIKVLIVDDSAMIRSLLARELKKGGDIEVIGTAPDPYIARDKIVELKPDVLTLDVEMPRMDGITFLRRLMHYHPMPVIVFSSLTGRGTQVAVEALAAGAVDVISKPGMDCSVSDLSRLLIEKIHVASRARVQPLSQTSAPFPPPFAPLRATAEKIFALGASTGGVQALTEILSALPATAPGTLVVQHMPPRFTASFAQRLNELCAMEVKEAVDGDRVIFGRVLMAPGGQHMLLRRSGNEYYVQVKEGPDVCHQCPSVEILFDSVAQCAGSNAVGAILTGMGLDGARGLLNMRKAGARTIAQDEHSCTVFGMPMEAIKCGAAEKTVPLRNISNVLLSMAKERVSEAEDQAK